MAQSVWTGGSHHTGLAALPHENIHVFSAIIFKTAFAVIAGVLFGIVLLGVILFIPLLKWNRMEISQIFKTYE